MIGVNSLLLGQIIGSLKNWKFGIYFEWHNGIISGGVRAIKQKCATGDTAREEHLEVIATFGNISSSI